MSDELLGRPLVAARTVERCGGCRTERAVGSTQPCRCAQPRWTPYCTKCAKAIAGDICEHCLAVATENGRQVRAFIEKNLAARGGVDGAIAHHARLRARVDTTMREFGLDAIVKPLPPWAAQLADKSTPMPPGAERSRVKSGAIRSLRLEDAAVRVAVESLGYSGLPAERKLAATLDSGDRAAAKLARWDGLIAHPEQERELREASESLLAGDAAAATMLETIKKRDVSRVIDAALRRGNAVESCRRALEIA